MKKLTTNLSFIIIVALLIGSCQQRPTDVSAEIQKANDVFGETFKSGDAEAMANLYTANGVLYPPNSPAIRGTENIKEFWKGAYTAGLTGAKLETITAEAYGNHAIEEGKVTLYVGDQVVGEEKYIVVWHKEDGKWKLHQDIFNSVWPKPDNVSKIQKGYDAFAKGDIPGVLAGLDENIEWNEAENFIYADGNPYIGHDALVNGVFARIGKNWEYWNLVDKKFHEMSNDMVLVTGRYQGKYKKNGKKIDAQFAHVWTLRDGKASSFQQYTDTKQVAKAVR